jgi:hypothetical protein
MIKNEITKKHLEESFKFLTEKDFHFSTFEYYGSGYGNWKIAFESKVCTLDIYSDRSSVNAVTTPANADIQRKFGLSTLVLYISHGERFIGHYEGPLSNQSDQIERLAKVLEEYIDEIINVLSAISVHYDGLEKAGKVVFQRAYEGFEKKRYKTL